MKTLTKQIIPLTLLATLSSPITLVHSESLAMPKSESQNSSARSIAKPEKGMSKAQVASAFGEPDSKHGPTGEPAIYFWEYPSFTVYFEADYVIHAVSKHR